MMVNGKMIKEKEKEYFIIIMVINMMEWKDDKKMVMD